MARQLMSVTVKGREHTWSFNFYGDPRHLDDWLADDLDVMVVLNTIPEWVADFGLVRPWCFLQDVFNFKWPFGGWK